MNRRDPPAPKSSTRAAPTSNAKSPSSTNHPPSRAAARHMVQPMSDESIQEVLTQFAPEPDRLLREISKHISDEMLQQIAAADYSIGQEEHLAALRQVRDTASFPQKMYWYPGRSWNSFATCSPGGFRHLRSLDAHFLSSRAPPSHPRAIQLRGWGQYGVHAHPVDPKSACFACGDFLAEAIPFAAWLLLHSEPEGRDPQVCAYGIGLLVVCSPTSRGRNRRRSYFSRAMDHAPFETVLSRTDIGWGPAFTDGRWKPASIGVAGSGRSNVRFEPQLLLSRTAWLRGTDSRRAGILTLRRR